MGSHHGRPKDQGIPLEAAAGKAGPALALSEDEYYVIRTSVLSIVLVLTIGPDAALLCKAWCHPGVAAIAECHEQSQTSTPNAMGDDSCSRVAVNATILIKEDPRGVSDPDSWYSLVVPCYHAPAAHREVHYGTNSGRSSPHDSRPLTLALRI
jgi:hypothetical protein